MESKVVLLNSAQRLPMAPQLVHRQHPLVSVGELKNNCFQDQSLKNLVSYATLPSTDYIEPCTQCFSPTISRPQSSAKV